MVDGAARMAVRLCRFSGWNHLHPAADGRHGRAAGHRMSVFEQDAVVRVAVAGCGHFVKRVYRVLPLIDVWKRGTRHFRRARANRAILLSAVAVALDNRLRRALGVILMKPGVKMTG